MRNPIEVVEPERADVLGALRPVPLGNVPDVLSVDLEKWFGTPCEDEVTFLLELFARMDAKATFFVLGSVAEQEPDLIRRIDAAGHEIGCHGWDHDQLFKKTPAVFRRDLARAVDTLSSLVGKRILGYRAAHFSIVEETGWALDALAEAGFRYDSSIFPIAGPRYGIARFPRGAVRVVRRGVTMLELPPSTVRHLGTNLPVAGGGYLRLMPYAVAKRAVESVHRDGLPFVLYCHPYEFHLERLRWPAGPGALGRLGAAARESKANLLRGTMRAKLAALLRDFRFTSCARVLGGELGA